MPTVNIPPRVRFALYLVGALASLAVIYAVDKSWAGDAEVRLVQGLVALLNLLAASNVQGRILGKALYRNEPPTTERPGGMRAPHDSDPH